MNCFEFDNHGAELSNLQGFYNEGFSLECRRKFIFVLVLILFEELAPLCHSFGSQNNSNFACFPVPPSVTFSLSLKWLPNPFGLARLIGLVGYLTLN